MQVWNFKKRRKNRKDSERMFWAFWSAPQLLPFLFLADMCFQALYACLFHMCHHSEYHFPAVHVFVAMRRTILEALISVDLV